MSVLVIVAGAICAALLAYLVTILALGLHILIGLRGAVPGRSGTVTLSRAQTVETGGHAGLHPAE